MIDVDILKQAEKAHLKIVVDNDYVLIKHKLRLTDKSILGVTIFLCGGVFMCIIPYVKNSDLTTKALGMIIGLSFIAISILTLIRQFIDCLKINNKKITIRYNLKSTSVSFKDCRKVKMKIENMEIKRVGTLGSNFIIINHYLETINKEIQILSFQMDNSNRDNAIKLGNKMTQIINDKLHQLT